MNSSGFKICHYNLYQSNFIGMKTMGINNGRVNNTSCVLLFDETLKVVLYIFY